MKKMSETILFFGSGPVAAQSLELLLRDFSVEAVVTKPRPAHHKGAFPVVDIAKKHNLPLHYASNKSELTDLFASKPVESQLAVLIDFGIIISQPVIDYFPLGIINSHFSVLPEWRGADPITFAILSGQKSTGVSLMRLVEAMDEGPLLAFGEYELPKDITTPQLTEHLIQFSHQLLRAELPKYVANPNGVLAPQSITGRKVSYSQKLSKADGQIDWSKPALELEREVRAYLDWPKSQTRLAGKDLIITQAKVVPSQGRPGAVNTKGHRLIVNCGQDSLEILRLKPAGKAEMSAADFINGHPELAKRA